MVQELGETRDELSLATWKKAASIAEERKSEVKPFYIVYAAKVDPALSGAIVNGLYAAGGIREAWRLTHNRPQLIFGQLVWYVDNSIGMFEFIPELSAPPDLPLDPSLLSDRKEDQFSSVMQKGKNMNALVS